VHVSEMDDSVDSVCSCVQLYSFTVKMNNQSGEFLFTFPPAEQATHDRNAQRQNDALQYNSVTFTRIYSSNSSCLRRFGFLRIRGRSVREQSDGICMRPSENC
jgi:hypothetical protein